MKITENMNTEESVVENKFNNELIAYYKNKINAVKQLWTIVTISDAVFYFKCI